MKCVCIYNLLFEFSIHIKKKEKTTNKLMEKMVLTVQRITLYQFRSINASNM